MDTIQDAAPQQKHAPNHVVILATVATTAPPSLFVSTARELMILHQKNL